MKFTWTISQLDTAPKEGTKQNLVKTIHWRYKAVDGDYQAETYSSFACAEPGNDFIAYDNLTEADVISWLESGLDVPSMQESLTSQIEAQKNPPIVVKPLPWVPEVTVNLPE